MQNFPFRDEVKISNWLTFNAFIEYSSGPGDNAKTAKYCYSAMLVRLLYMI